MLNCEFRALATGWPFRVSYRESGGPIIDTQDSALWVDSFKTDLKFTQLIRLFCSSFL